MSLLSYCIEVTLNYLSITLSSYFMERDIFIMLKTELDDKTNLTHVHFASFSVLSFFYPTEKPDTSQPGTETKFGDLHS